VSDDKENNGGKDNKEPDIKIRLGPPPVETPPDEQRGSDRRKINIGSPTGNDRRRGDRRKSKSSVSRERYLDMVIREKALFAQQGVNKTTEQLLVASGVVTDNEATSGERDSATGDQLRAAIPSQSWQPLNIHLVKLEKGVLTVAPFNDISERQEKLLKSAAVRSGFNVEKIEIELWDRADLLKTLRAVHDLSADRTEKTLAIWLSDVDNGLMLNQFMRDMMAEALQMRASDIHLVQDNAVDAPNWIKYRVDGDLIPMHLLPADAMARLTTLIKREAGLNFGDRSTPKDGRFGFVWQGRSIDVRVAAGPQAQDGEKITLRLLDRASLKSFEDLFSKYENVKDTMAKLLSPEIKGGGGLIIMSGPTGSGKSTTLYACVLEIDRRRRHVLTIEDPIEYEMRYATQWQVMQMAGASRDFSDLIRAAMRHDPDYIIIGEMRDAATVETALKAAESGHTVISTIHADTAAQTLERLKSFIPSERERSSTYTLSQQIRAILNQRLIKTLCHSCRIKAEAKDVLGEAELAMFKLDPEQVIYTQNTGGCDLCNNTGILGRTLLLETMMITPPPYKREPIFKDMMTNVSKVIEEEGVEYMSRRESLSALIKEGLIDPKLALLIND